MERDDFRSLVESTRNKISTLNASQASLEKFKEELISKRNFLLQELSQIDQDIADVDNKLSQVPSGGPINLKKRSKSMPVKPTSFIRTSNRFLARPMMITEKSKKPMTFAGA
jgi:hypothetical protein